MTTPGMFSPSLPLEYVDPQGNTRYLNPYSQQYIRNKSYALRLQRGFGRGLSQSEARGHGISARGLTESQERVARATERGDLSPYQLFLGGFERRYGFSYQYWRLIYRRYIKEINQRSWPSGPRGQQDEYDPRIFASDISRIKSLYDQGYRDLRGNSPVTWQEWVENHLAIRLDAIVQWQDNHNKTPGREMFSSHNEIWARVATPAVFVPGAPTAISGPRRAWWFYH